MRCNDEGKALIKKFEGLKLSAYLDINGIPTIGWGHTGSDVHFPSDITIQVAEQMFENDLEHFEYGCDLLVSNHSVSENMFSSLVCFAFNLGLRHLRDSTLLKLVNKGDYKNAAEEFKKWSHSYGKEIPGLLARRLAERDLFLTPDRT